MFTKLITKASDLMFSGKASLYLRVAILTLMLVFSLTMTGTALAFGPMPGNVGG